jgi:hypothetical protein
LPTTFDTFAGKVPQLCTKGATFVHGIPLKKVKFKVKNQEAINNSKNIQRFISK